VKNGIDADSLGKRYLGITDVEVEKVINEIKSVFEGCYL